MRNDHIKSMIWQDQKDDIGQFSFTYKETCISYNKYASYRGNRVKQNKK